MESEGARQIVIPRRPQPRGSDRNADRDGFAPCVVCGRGVRLNDHEFFLWVHHGGSHAVTQEEGERLNARANGEAGDLGGQPIGRECLKYFPELKPFLIHEMNL